MPRRSASSTAAPAPAVPADAELLHAAEVLALAAAVKSRESAAARALMPDNSHSEVDFAVRVRGLVAKGAPTPAAESTAPPAVNVRCETVMLALLDRLNVTPGTLRRHLRAILGLRAGGVVQPDGSLTIEPPADADLLADAFDQVAAEAAEGLPTRTVPIAGRAATVRADVRVEWL